MHEFLPLLLLVACASAADPTTTVSLFLPGFDQQALVGSIVGAKASTTTYAIECAPSSSSDDCGIDDPITITAAPDGVHLTMSNSEVQLKEDCTLSGTTAGVCTISLGGKSANDPGVQTETLSQEDITFMPVVITAGAAAATGSSGASATATSTGSNTTVSTASPSGSRATASGASATGTAHAGNSTMTGGMPQITGNAKFVVGGAAAAAMLLAL